MESFEAVVAKAREILSESGRGVAQREIHEALKDLSRRPEADLTGALQHGFAAVECVARDISGEPNLTLGRLLKKHPGLIPSSSLLTAVENMWEFACDQGRHLREGDELCDADVELAVVTAAAIATYLVRKTTNKGESGQSLKRTADALATVSSRTTCVAVLWLW